MTILKRRPFTRLLLVVAAATLVATLPFRWLPPPTSAFMLQARWTGLGRDEPCKAISRIWVDWGEIAPAAPLAVIAAEDQLFPTHWGVDIKAITSAIEEYQTEGRQRGASTITQQLAKNLYLWPGRSWLRKALEAGFSLVLEATWPKRRILEVYLNSVQFGDCTFGVEAASRRFFGKPASRLSEREAALLASALPNPVTFAVDRPTAYMQQRTGWILEQMRLLGGVSYLKTL